MKKLDKNAIGVVLAFCGIAIFAAIGLAVHFIAKAAPELRAFLLWLTADARVVIGMALGMIVAFGIAWCIAKDIERNGA